MSQTFRAASTDDDPLVSPKLIQQYFVFDLSQGLPLAGVDSLQVFRQVSEDSGAAGERPEKHRKQKRDDGNHVDILTRLARSDKRTFGCSGAANCKQNKRLLAPLFV